MVGKLPKATTYQELPIPQGPPRLQLEQAALLHPDADAACSAAAPAQ